jgi:hypothetical protein
LVLTSFSSLTLADSTIINAQEAIIYLKENHPINFDKVLLYIWGPINKGEEVYTTKQHILNVPEDGYIFYIDLYPRANLFHPVQYIFLSESTTEFIIIDENCPPLNFNDYQLVDTEMGHIFLSAQNRRAPIPDGKIPSPTANPLDNRWAVLMNGGYNTANNHVRYWNDLSNIYIALTSVYGYLDEQIIVLCSDGLDPAIDQSNGQNSDPDLDGDGDDDIMYSCVLSNVDQVFGELADVLTEGSELFIFTTDHGSSISGMSTLFNLWNMEELTDYHFAELLNNLPDCEIVCTFEPCFSGGFLNDVVVPPGPRIASSACRYDENSYAMDNLLYDEYAFYWTAAVTSEDAFGNQVDADYNQDGIITMDEAYVFAESKDTAQEHPQYDDYPEGIGTETSLWIETQPPVTPLKPDGPETWAQYMEVTFKSSTTEPDGESIFYMFDWGDGNNSGWLGSYESGQIVEAGYSWDEIGEYKVKVKAKDINNVESEWSESTTISIVVNEPPEKPTIAGQQIIKLYKLVYFGFYSIDPEGNDVYYKISWGDGHIEDYGPFVSGEQIALNHSWGNAGDFTIVAKPIDKYGSKGPQSEFIVKIIKNKAANNRVINKYLVILINRLPNIIKMIKNILN